MKTIQLGISTCPNDTFTFHALLTGQVSIPGVRLEISLMDVEELNRGLFEKRFDVCKVSAHAALLASEHVLALGVGWALGHKLGPVVLSAQPIAAVAAETRVLTPGQWTTAHLLWRLFHNQAGRIEQRVFSQIMPALQAGEADLGVCIHEGRFTWREAGLLLFEDLGATWERETGAPLPLGGIVASRSLGGELQGRLQAGIEASLAWGLANRGATLESMRRYAQEESEQALWSHVELYVNPWTQRLGVEGRQALATLSHLGAQHGLIPPGSALEVLD